MSRTVAATARVAPAWGWAAPVAAFLALLGVLALVNRSSESTLHGDPAAAHATEAAGAARGAGGDTAVLVAELQAAVRQSPDDAGAYALLGDAYYQRARETADATYYTRAADALDEALRLDPEEVTATIAQGTLALARHDFRAGLALGQRAHALAPDLVRPYAVIADAQVELGRYAAAARTLGRMVALKPSLPAYSRVSYFRELHGDLDGAVQAMRLAASASGGSGEAAAYVQSLLGNLELDRGRYAAAEAAYREALLAQPGFAAARAGLARLDAGRGELAAAIARYRRLVERLPLPEYAVALGDAERATGRVAAARRDYALVAAEARLLRANGVDTDVDLALFEADHGQSARAVELAAGAWRRAPGVRAADARAWALHGAGRDDAARRWSRRAMRLGSRDPFFLYRAGLIARDSGHPAAARRLLSRLLTQSPRFSPLYAPRAERALKALR